MRIIFFGSGAFGQPSLKAIAQRHEVVLVVTQPDRPRGRGLHLAPPPIKETALELGLPVFQPENVNVSEVQDRLRQAAADLGVVIAYGQKIGAEVRGLFSHQCVNLHASLLPRWRGAAPINWAILAGDQQTGVTIFRLVDKMDAGSVLRTAATPIHFGETAHDLHDRLSLFGVEPLLEAIGSIADGTAVFTTQDEAQVTQARKLSRADSVVDFSRSAKALADQVHGLWSWPGAQAGFNLPKGKGGVVTFSRVEPVTCQLAAAPPGTLFAPDLVACGEGWLRILRLKPAGKHEMSWTDFSNGRHIRFGPQGDRFEQIRVERHASA